MLHRFWPNTRGYRRAMAAAVLMYSLATLADAVGVSMLSELIDGALTDGDLDAFWGPAGLWAVVVLVAAVVMYTAALLSSYASESFGVGVRADTYAHLLRLSPETLDQHPTGDLISRVVDDVDEVEALVVTGMIDVAAGTVGVLVFGGAALLLSWQLALMVFAGAPVMWLFNRWMSTRFTELSMHARRTHGELTTALEQGLGNVALVQTHTGQRAEARRLGGTSSRFMLARLRQQRVAAVQGPLTEMIETFGLLGVLAVGTLQIAGGALSVGGLLAFTAYLGFLYPAVTGLGQLGMTIATAEPSAVRLLDLLDADPAVSEPVQPAGSPVPRGELEVRDVGVLGADGRYRLDGVSFRVQPGEMVAITGASGSGKSTLVQVLARLRDPSFGQVLLDGVDLRDYPLARLHRAITVLSQEPLMFDGTVRENLMYGLSGGTDGSGPATAAIRVVTEAAGAEEFLSRMPEGWRTPLGNRGRSLSGGQRQRIAIARALLRDGVVLVLDEPSTGLDAGATARLVDTLRDYASDRAVVVITHDPLLTVAADRVIHLAGGRIVADPSPPGSRRAARHSRIDSSASPTSGVLNVDVPSVDVPSVDVSSSDLARSGWAGTGFPGSAGSADYPGSAGSADFPGSAGSAGSGGLRTVDRSRGPGTRSE
jgi:ATP-binding cassette subfamily B protein